MNISLVIPTINTEKTLDACLYSLNKQLEKNDELIIVDSYSTDKTLDIAKRYGAKIIKKRCNRSAARNTGWKNAKNDVIIFIESDSIYYDNYIKIVKMRMTDAKISCMLDKRELYQPKTWVAKTLQEEFELRQNNNFSPKNAWILRKKVLREAGGFDETLEYGEDIDLGIRIRKLGYEIFFEKKAVQYHLGEPDSMTKLVKRTWKFSKNMHKFYIKNNNLPAAKIILFLTAVVFPPLLLIIFIINIIRYDNLSLGYKIKLSFISIIRNLIFAIGYVL
ncbi:Glycosyltransferase AglI [Candidatus Tiddalikarchaeum anstoanum]|nr:Glycosyltransferase AglI [Candidatus Tiddalikarchaeum anstoanum]